jgi:NADPH2:quinone reductase
MTDHRAAMCRTIGPPAGVQVERVEVPAVGPGQVRARVHTAAVNFPDVLVIADQYQIKVPVPFVPGSEFAGVVDEVGEGVDDVAAGDRVFGSVLVGAFAEHVITTPAGITAVPDGVAMDVAAGFGVAHRTAYHVLRSVASLQPGEDLVVLGAGGGVGLAAVQLGKVLGATVTAVASSAEKLAAARACGADQLVNYREVDLRQALRELLPGGADVVVDPVGGELSEPALRALCFDGRFVTVGYASGVIPRIKLNLVLLKGIRVLGFEFRSFVEHRAEDMARDETELLQLLADGRVAPYVGARFDLDQVVEALRHVADGKAIGKVLLSVADD